MILSLISPLRTSTLVLLTLAALPLGCSPHSVTLNPQAPIAMPDGYVNIHAQGKNLPDQWWKDFGDAQLNDLVDNALRGNLQLRAAWERLRQVKLIAKQAGSVRFPSINIVGNVNKSEPENKFVASAPISIEARYEVDLFKKNSNATSAALRDALSARDQVEIQAMGLVAQISDSWFALITQQARLALLEEQIKVSKNFLELAEMRIGQGLGSSLDVLQQRQQLAAIEGQRPMARAGVQLLQNQLAVLTGQTPNSLQIKPGTQLPALPQIPALGIPADLLTRRPDIRAARQQVEAADYRVAAAIANRLPSIRIGGAYSPFLKVGTTYTTDTVWNIFASLFAPIIDFGRLKAEVARNKSVRQEKSYNFGHALLQAMLEVENALVQERHQAQFIQQLEGQLVIAQNTLEEARQRYSAGLGNDSFLQILSALSSSQRIEQSLLQAKQQAFSYRIQLNRALGGSWTQTLDEKKLKVDTKGNNNGE